MKKTGASKSSNVTDTHLAQGHLLMGWEHEPTGKQIGFVSDKAGPARGKTPPVWLENGEAHGLTIAPTGAGKGRANLIPMLLTHRGSCVVVDPKGEAALVTAQRRREMGQRVVMLDPFHLASEKTDALNPMEAIQFTGDSVEEFALTVPSLLHPENSGSLKEPFWDIQGDSLLGGVACHLLSTGEPEERNFMGLRKILMSDDVVYNLAVLLDTVGKTMPKMAKQQIGSFLQTTDVTRSGILSTAQQHLRILADPAVEAALGPTSFSLADFKSGEPMTIYLILPSTKLPSHGLLLRNWLSTLFAVAMSRKELPLTQTMFAVDEVAALGTMSQLRVAMTLMRGYGVRCWLYIQDLSQLKHLYPLDWETLTNNAGVVQTFGLTNHLMAKQVAEIFDVRPSELLALKPDEQMLLFAGGVVKRARKLDYLQDKVFDGLFSPNPRYAVRGLGR